MSNILAIDPGYDRMGIAVINTEPGVGKEKVVYSDCVITDKNSSFEERLEVIYKAVSKTIEGYSPDVLAIESLYFSSNKKTAIGVAEAKGVVVLAAQLGGLKIYEYSPPEIKVAITGHGSSDKKQMENMVRRLVALEKKQVLDDELDAIAIGLTHNASRQKRT